MDRESFSTQRRTQKIDVDVENRHITLMKIYDALPSATTVQYWRLLDADDIPLEVLVRCCRDALARGDQRERERIIETIVRRTQRSNEQWANSILQKLVVPYDVRAALIEDLYADLYERILRGLLDRKRLIWEESFSSCLLFERRHALAVLLQREGWHKSARAMLGQRVPRSQLNRIQSWSVVNSEESVTLEIEDEYMHKLHLTIEYVDLFQQVLLLPMHLKAIILLIFREGLTEKEVASLLKITDRTVRNRMHEALKILYERLKLEPGGAYNDG